MIVSASSAESLIVQVDDVAGLLKIDMLLNELGPTLSRPREHAIGDALVERYAGNSEQLCGIGLSRRPR
jgi:hypothetical protein